MSSETVNNDDFIPQTRDTADPPAMKIVGEFIRGVPNLPVHVHKLLEIVSSEDSDSLEVANAASADPGLVSKILQVINSSYYGLSNRTDNIHFAIVLLGFNEVRKIALQTSFAGIFAEGITKEGYDIRGLWEHSYLVSVCAESIGRSKDTKYAGELLTFGLLHDIGKFALFKLALAMKERGVSPYRVLDDKKEACTTEKEEALFGVNHAMVGGMLAERWGLSDRVKSVIEYHHHPSFFPVEDVPGEYFDDVAIICIADAIVHFVSGAPGHPVPPDAFFDAVGLPVSIEKCIDDELRQSIIDARNFMSHVV